MANKESADHSAIAPVSALDGGKTKLLYEEWRVSRLSQHDG